jgi:hypothetical protein
MRPVPGLSKRLGIAKSFLGQPEIILKRPFSVAAASLTPATGCVALT